MATNRITPHVLFIESEKNPRSEDENPFGGLLFTDLSGRNGFDVEMDHFAIFLPDKSGYVYQIEEEDDSLIGEIQGFDFIATRACGPCVTVCGYVKKDTKTYEAIAHVSSLHSLNVIMDLMLARLIEHSQMEDSLQTNFFLFGGTEDSLKEFFKLDEDITPPNEYSFADSYPRLINNDNTNISIISTPSKIIIMQFDEAFNNIKNYEQNYDFEKDITVYNQSTNQDKLLFVLEEKSSIKPGKSEVEDEPDDDLTEPEKISNSAQLVRLSKSEVEDEPDEDLTEPEKIPNSAQQNVFFPTRSDDSKSNKEKTSDNNNSPPSMTFKRQRK